MFQPKHETMFHLLVTLREYTCSHRASFKSHTTLTDFFVVSTIVPFSLSISSIVECPFDVRFTTDDDNKRLSR